MNAKHSPRKRKLTNRTKSGNTYSADKEVKSPNISAVKAKSKKKNVKQHGLSSQDQVHKSRRNKMLIAVLIYIAIGAGVLLWKGMAKLPEIPPELESEILGSYPQQLKDIEMPKTLNKNVNAKSATGGDGKEKVSPDLDESESNSLKADSNSISEEQHEALKSFTDFKPRILNSFKLAPLVVENGSKKVTREWKELQPKKNTKNSSVRIFVMNNFLSDYECDGLIAAHEDHLNAHKEHKPIVCFSDESTMLLYLAQAKVNWAKSVSEKDFLSGTSCLNESLSSQLDGRLPWSYSTSFYPGESTFSSIYDNHVLKHVGLNKENGGKFQITSYGKGVGYKIHTDCLPHGTELRDRYATILVYLNDVDEGGETEFAELGIKVKPRKGRAIVWNNMDSKGNCDLTSYHRAAPVLKGKKYILQRWYYYQNFVMLGKRPQAPSVPPRTSELTPQVSCDQFDSGSCRWYDEWNYDHLTDYRRQNAV